LREWKEYESKNNEEMISLILNPHNHARSLR
jgi:hypothetical protein